MNYFDLFGPPRVVGLRRGLRYGQRRQLHANVLHPSWEPAIDDRFLGHAYDIRSTADARDYMSFHPDEYDPHPGRMDVPDPGYLPYHADVPPLVTDDPLPPPREIEPEPSPVRARYTHMTDAMFQQALQELREEHSLPDRLQGVVPFEPPPPLPPLDDPLEELLAPVGMVTPGVI